MSIIFTIHYYYYLILLIFKNPLLLLLVSSQIINITPLPLPFFSSNGRWHLLHESIGISAMHMQLLRNNKVIIYDRTDFGRSNISLPGGRCRVDPDDTALQVDCTAHSVLYDILSNTFRPLTVQTDLWCSSGAVLPNGTLIQTGGYNDGDHVVRVFTPCLNQICDWIEIPNYLSQRRWYATNQILPNGEIIIIGGRRQFNYEFFPKRINNNNNNSLFELNFLRETSDFDENNLYPFVHLLPDGNLFLFANTRSILFDYNRNSVVKEFPPIPNSEPRNYPSSGSSVLFPLDEKEIIVEIMICGGAPSGSHRRAMRGAYVEALSSCGRLKVSDENPSWQVEYMPMSRVMGDMVILPSGHVIIINGAQRGTAGWECGEDPVTTPILYDPAAEHGERFSVMESSPRPRLYHSTAILLPDGRVLIGGSNPHVYYNFTGVNYPTDLSLESFSPAYLSLEHKAVRPRIVAARESVGYGELMSVVFRVIGETTLDSLSFRIIAPSFSTHAFGMNQRMIVLRVVSVVRIGLEGYNASVLGPSTAEIAPPGYYMMFVVHGEIPSHATWIKLH